MKLVWAAAIAVCFAVANAMNDGLRDELRKMPERAYNKLKAMEKLENLSNEHQVINQVANDLIRQHAPAMYRFFDDLVCAMDSWCKSCDGLEFSTRGRGMSGSEYVANRACREACGRITECRAILANREPTLCKIIELLQKVAKLANSAKEMCHVFILREDVVCAIDGVLNTAQELLFKVTREHDIPVLPASSST